MVEEVIDGEAVEEPVAATPESGTETAEPHAVTALPVPTQPTEVLRPIATEAEVRDAMTEYQRIVRAVLDESDYQSAERGKKFVKKSGWRKIAKAFGLSLEIVSIEITRDDQGHPERATVIVRAIAPNGQVQDGDGYCSIDEPNFQRGSGKQKAEQNLRATATTRAKNRAISDLVGMGEVSAEEVSGMGNLHDEPAYTDASPIEDALSSLVPAADIQRLLDWLRKENGGVIPQSVGRAVQATALLASRHECTPTREPFDG